MFLSAIYNKNNNKINKMSNNKENECPKKKWTKVSIQHSAEIAALHQKSNLKIKELVGMYPQYSPRSIYRHSKTKFNEETHDKRKFNKGRPKLLNDYDRRNIVRNIKYLRTTEGNFTSRRLASMSGLSSKIKPRTFRSYLNKCGFRYRRARKKGLMSIKDLRARKTFCSRCIRLKLGLEFWTKGVSMFVDGKGFAWKRNPRDQARAPKAMLWRQANEGLAFGCTAKAGKAGVTNLNFVVGISYNKGVVLCERYMGTMTGEKYAYITKHNFPQALENSTNPRAKRIVQDNCPRQQSKVAKLALAQINAKQMKIPARSPDINCIENVFAQVCRLLDTQAIERNITSETKDEFESRVKETLFNFPVQKINDIITSMPRRLKAIVQAGGKRINY